MTELAINAFTFQFSELSSFIAKSLEYAGRRQVIEPHDRMGIGSLGYEVTRLFSDYVLGG